MCKYTQLSHELDDVNIMFHVCVGTLHTQQVASRQDELGEESLGEPFPCRSNWEREALSASCLPTRPPVRRYVRLKPPWPLFARSRLGCSQRGHEIATVLACCPADALDFASALGCLHKTPRLAIASAAPEVLPAAPATPAEPLTDLRQPSEAAKVNRLMPRRCGKLDHSSGRRTEARRHYSNGVKECLQCIYIWPARQ